MISRNIYLLLISILYCLKPYLGAASVSFSYSGHCQNDTTQFTNTTTWGTKYSWKFGDGGTSHEKNPKYSYKEAGAYSVTLVVSKDTISDSLTQAVTIYTTEYTNLLYDNHTSCSPTEFYVCDTSIFTTSRTWDFGDGVTSTDSSVTHVYNIAGYYTVSIETQTTYGCTRKTTYDSIVFNMPQPIAEFTLSTSNPTIYDESVSFIDISSGEENNWWYWELGDGSISIDHEPKHTYEEPGEYRIKLIIMNVYNCSDTIDHTIFISDQSSWYIPSSFTPNGDNLNDEFLPIAFNMEAKEFEFYVYDKWGNLVFQTKDIESPWDGRSFKNQSLLPTGVYTWQMRIVYETGYEVKKQGFIKLLSKGK